MRRVAGVVVLPTAMVWGLAAQAPAQEPPTFTVRDSAGVQIVESLAPAWGSGEAWTIDPEPVLEIGSTAPEAPAHLEQVGRVHRLSDGRIAVVDGGRHMILIFGPDGSLAAAIDGRGDLGGPFSRTPAFALLPGDTLITWEQLARRIAWFGPRGEFLAEEWVPRPERGDADVFGLRWAVPAPDGSPLVLGYAMARDETGQVASFRRERGAPEGWHSRRLFHFLAPGTGEFTQVQGTFEFRSIKLGTSVPWEASEEPVLVGDPPRIVITDGPAWQLTEYGLDGTLTRLVRAAVPRILGDSAAAALSELFSDELVAPFLEHHPDTLAAIGVGAGFDSGPSILSDGDGRLWVRRSNLGLTFRSPTRGLMVTPRRTFTVRYDIMDADRRWLGSVEIPSGIGRIEEVGPDYLISVSRDETRVPFVKMYRIRRGGGEG